MEYLYPDYYGKFECIAGECEDTCCAQWQIVIDDKSMKKYKKYKGDYQKELIANIDEKEQAIVQKEGRRCSFLNCDNLCEMYINSGEDMLCKTCRRYPRHFEEYENFRAVTLSISCPEVARIILGRKSKVRFKYMTTQKEEKPYKYFDFMLFTKLQMIQEFIIRVLQDRSVDFTTRVGLVLGCTHDLQKRIRNNQLFEIDELLDKYEDESFREKAVNTLKCMRQGTLKAESLRNRARIFMNMHRMEVLNQDWPDYMTKCEEELFAKGIDSYYKIKDEFENYYKDRMTEYEQILIYFITTYFLASVYDGEMYDKVAFAVASTIFIKDMDIATYIVEGGKLSFEKQVEIVHKYSRELEHSDPNVALLEDMIASQKEYKAQALIGCF